MKGLSLSVKNTLMNKFISVVSFILLPTLMFSYSESYANLYEFCHSERSEARLPDGQESQSNDLQEIWNDFAYSLHDTRLSDGQEKEVLQRSQNVTITGIAEGQAGKLVRVIVYADQFSNLDHTIAQTHTDNSGKFFMQFDVDQTKFALLALGLDKGEFYLKPGTHYNFNILIDTVLGKGSIFDQLPLNFTVETDDGGIQQSIGDFNMLYNDFIYNNINSIYKSKDKSVVTGFVQEMHEKYTDNKAIYVRDYVKYSLASLLWLSRKESNRQILVNYFVNKPILYKNIQYTDFFKEFFKSYFTSEKIYTYEELILAINNSEPIDIVDKLIARDEKLALDDRIREIVEMLLLSRHYHNRDVKKQRVISKYNDIANSSEFIENRLIARNFITKLQELQNGTKAPCFILTNAKKDSISLSDYAGKFVLLSFVKEDCSICDFHMQLLNDIREQNGDKFDIVTIVAGDEFDRLVDFANERGYKWSILKTNENILLLEAYNIRAYPSYVFINPDGTIAYAHLPMPDENMELYLQRFMSGYNEVETNK